MSLPLAIRAAILPDYAFIADSWVRSFAPFRPRQPDPTGGSRWTPMDAEDYRAGQNAIADSLMGTVLVAVSTAEGSEGQLVGWISADAGTLHYVYTRQAQRRFGVARRLLDEVGPLAHYSHWTPMVARLAPGATFNPYAAWRPR